MSYRRLAFELRQSDDWLIMRSIERTISYFNTKLATGVRYGLDPTDTVKLLERYEAILKNLHKKEAR